MLPCRGKKKGRTKHNNTTTHHIKRHRVYNKTCINRVEVSRNYVALSGVLCGGRRLAREATSTYDEIFHFTYI